MKKVLDSENKFRCADKNVIMNRQISQVSVLGPDGRLPLEQKAFAIFRERLFALGRIESRIVEPEHLPDRHEPKTRGVLLIAGVCGRTDRAETLCRQHGLPTPVGAESFTLHTGHSKNVPIYLYAHDQNGLLYGLGYLLRQFRFSNGRLEIPSIRITQSPAIKERGIYFATHFNNYYERAPLEELDYYVEEMALWGINLLTVWFDMNWFSWGFWNDKDSHGMFMIQRLRRILETGRQCGMRVGITGITNEGFAGQVPVRLRADMSCRRGGFYPETQICPSKPGGLKMILGNRRRIMELFGPVDFYFLFSYDQGGCGCAQCTKSKHGWGETSLKIARKIQGIAKSVNPSAKFIISTWFMDEGERGLVYKLCRKRTGWIDGIITAVGNLLEGRLPEDKIRLVFPEISMFGCFFTSYGCNGANPAPRRFTEQARAVAATGFGATPYSEGLYEDINKIIWASILWNPRREAREVVEEYSRYYFGHRNEKAAADLIMGLENTWGLENLLKTTPEVTARLRRQAVSLKSRLPDWKASRLRWRILYDRTQLDEIMVRIGPDTELLRELRQLLEGAPYAPTDGLRRKSRGLLRQLRHRKTLTDLLFEVHWRYLRAVHTEQTNLIFRPDQFVGERNWETLIEPLNKALAIRSDHEFRLALLKVFKRWFWFNDIKVKHMLL